MNVEWAGAEIRWGEGKKRGEVRKEKRRRRASRGGDGMDGTIQASARCEMLD